MTGPIDGDALLAKVQPQLNVHREQVCLRPDLVDEWHELQDALLTEQAAAATGSGGRLNQSGEKVPSTPEAKRIAKKLTAIQKKIEEASVWFTFRALSKDKFAELTSEHPPRKDNQFDLMRGYHIGEVRDALVRRCLIDPVFTDEGWLNLQGSIAASEWEALQQGAETAMGTVSTPGKSELASRILSQRGADSD